MSIRNYLRCDGCNVVYGFENSHTDTLRSNASIFKDWTFKGGKDYCFSCSKKAASVLECKCCSKGDIDGFTVTLNGVFCNSCQGRKVI